MILAQLRKLLFISNNQISKIASSNSPNVLVKKYFPSFFFAACFCIVIILFSAIQETQCNSIECRRAIDYFFLYYIICSWIFQFWSLLIFPRFVNKLDYVKLLLISVIICAVLFSIAWHFALLTHIIYPFSWLVDNKNEMWLISLVLLTSLIPLLYIFLSFVLILFFWGIPVYFYDSVFKVFTRSAAEKDINKLA